MAAGDVWVLPDGRRALELSGSRGGLLRVAALRSDWPFPAPPEVVARRLCTPQPSRYLHGAMPNVAEPARW